MSEIQRYMYARDGMVPDAEHLRGSGEPEFWVRFTDHEAERAENLATIDFLNKELRSAVDALADAEARIEGLVHKEQGFDNADMEYGYGRGLAESIRALAALTQPQAEQWHENDEADKAATAAGVADADLVTVKPPKPSVDENHGEVAMWARRMARHLGLDGEDGPSLEPYARAFLQAIQLADHRLMDTRDSDEPTDKEQV